MEAHGGSLQEEPKEKDNTLYGGVSFPDRAEDVDPESVNEKYASERRANYGYFHIGVRNPKELSNFINNLESEGVDRVRIFVLKTRLFICQVMKYDQLAATYVIEKQESDIYTPFKVEFPEPEKQQIVVVVIATYYLKRVLGRTRNRDVITLEFDHKKSSRTMTITYMMEGVGAEYDNTISLFTADERLFTPEELQYMKGFKRESSYNCYLNEQGANFMLETLRDTCALAKSNGNIELYFEYFPPYTNSEGSVVGEKMKFGFERGSNMIGVSHTFSQPTPTKRKRKTQSVSFEPPTECLPIQSPIYPKRFLQYYDTQVFLQAINIIGYSHRHPLLMTFGENEFLEITSVFGLGGRITIAFVPKEKDTESYKMDTYAVEN